MGGISALYILDSKGKVILCRLYRDNISQEVPDKFTQYIQEQNESSMKPVFCIDGVIYCWVHYRNLFFLGVTVQNTNAMMIIIFLYRLIEVLKDYFRSLEEESIRDNFVVTYELLDEMMDHGYPQLTDSKILRQYIKNQTYQLFDFRSTSSKPPACITNAISWRSEGIKHKKNEVFLDVIEKLNFTANTDGNVLHSEVIGLLKMKSYLSGMPELKLGLNDKLQFDAANQPGSKNFKAIELEDIKFHHCVRLQKFESDRIISFIPPDGDFELMSYRLGIQVKPLIWVDCTVNSGKARVEYTIKVKSAYKHRNVAKDVAITIPVGNYVDTPVFKTANGSVKYIPENSSLVWSLKHFPGQKSFTLNASFGFPSVCEKETSVNKRPILVSFEIPYFTVSNLLVRYIKISEAKLNYQALPWVRYITRNGEYQIRMS